MDLLVCHLGQVEYREAAALQERLRERVIAGELPELMLLLEHPPVYTVDAPDRHVRPAVPGRVLQERGIDVVRTPRGGQLTYHGPGQLVGYPIMRVASVPEYILTMEKAIVAALADAGLEAHTKLGHKHVGVWVGERKIASRGRAHLPRRLLARLRAQRRQRPRPVRAGSSPAGCPRCTMTSLHAEGIAEGLACFRKRDGVALLRGVRAPPAARLARPTRNRGARVWTSV